MRRVVFVAVGLCVAMTAPQVASATDGPLDEAGRRMRERDFTGTLTVRWDDGDSVRTRRVGVRAENGALALDGPAAMVAKGDERMVRHADGWQLIWPDAWETQPAPAMAHKYRVAQREGQTVAGRATHLVEVWSADVLRERVSLDVATGIVLRREQLGEDGRPVRMVSFDAISLGTSSGVERPRQVRQPRRTSVAKRALPAPYQAPARLAGGYQLLGTYRRDGAVQALYGDGLYTVSLFEQAGHLDDGGLPRAGRAVRVGTAEGRQYPWAGGWVVAWPAGPSIYTLVGDGPASDVLLAARSVPKARPVAFDQRVKRACRGLVEAFGGRL